MYVPTGSVAETLFMLVMLQAPVGDGVVTSYAQVVPSGFLISMVTATPGVTCETVPETETQFPAT